MTLIFKNKISEQIAKDVYDKVGEQILSAQQEVLKRRDKQMSDIIDKFEKDTRDTARILIMEVFDERVRQIIKEELIR